MENNKICKLLNTKYPIIQGGMAWIANAQLASAVSNAGGLGLIACGHAPYEVIKEEIRKAKELTDKPFGLNIMLMSPHVDDMVKLACEEGVKVVTTGAGNPAKYMEQFKLHDIKVIPVMPTVALAKKMEKMGADAIICEGMEAGGHVGKLTTMAMTPQIVDAISIPVIAAGGIADGRGVAAAFMLGAEGVQIGTRFLVAKECTVHQNYKDAVLKAKDVDTMVTGCSTGHPVRVIKNFLAKEIDDLEKGAHTKELFSIIEEKAQGALQKAVIDGNVQYSSLMAGQVAGMINKEQTVEEMIDEIITEYNVVIKSIKSM